MLPSNELEAWFAGLALTDGHGRAKRATIQFSVGPRDWADFRLLLKAAPGGYESPPSQDVHGNLYIPFTFEGWPTEWAAEPQWCLTAELRRHYMRGMIDGDGEVRRPYAQTRFAWNHRDEPHLGPFFTAMVLDAGFELGKPEVAGTVTRVTICPSRSYALYLYDGAEWCLERKRARAMFDSEPVEAGA